jgi:eukaryotic-like serine/threonine-protein kinase
MSKSPEQDGSPEAGGSSPDPGTRKADGDRDRWAEADALFSAALDLPPERREAFVRAQAALDPALRDAALALLSASETADSFLGERGAVIPADLLSELVGQLEAQDGPQVGERIGRYRLVREIGRGGTGTVFLAERDDGAFRQRVAVKLLRRGLDTEDVLARFRAERQILASLSHPNIARLLDGGAASDGRPYLVMELVDGEPITAYSDDHGLSLDDRLALFRTVAGAVQYAHRNLIVHRDLKPTNILVAADGTVKLLDFGIAKLLDPVGPEAGSLTFTGIRPMTPAYASPEQVRGEVITTSSDVYQLGLLLYELLTGQRPAGRRSGSTPEIERSLERRDLARPSSAVADGEVPAGLGDARRLRRRLRGDLDTIILKALHPEPDRRYESAAVLAEDVRRHLLGYPVLARPDSRAYRARRFVVRRRAQLAAGVLFLLLAAAYGFQLRRERDTATIERMRAEEVSAFLIGLFDASNLGRTDRADTLTARTLLARGAVRIRETLHDQPEVRAHLLTALGRAYNYLDGSNESFELLEEALHLRTGLYGPLDDRTAETLEALAGARSQSFHHIAADSLIRRAVDLRRRQSPSDTRRLASNLRHQADVKRNLGQLDSAELYVREALSLLEADGIDAGREHLASLRSLAFVLRALGDLGTAEQTYRLVLAEERAGGESMRRGMASTLNNLAYLLVLSEAYEEAEALYREALTIVREVYGDGQTRTRDAMLNLIGLLSRQARWAEAEALAAEAFEMDVAASGPDSWQVAQSIGRLGRLNLEAGDPVQAERRFRESLRMYASALGADHSWTAEARAGIGSALAAQRRYPEAEYELLAGLAILDASQHSGAPTMRRRVLERIIDFYEGWEKPDQAQRYRALLD